MDGIFRNSIANEGHSDGTGGRRLVHLHAIGGQAHGLNPPDNFVPVTIIADAADDLRLGAQGMRVVGEIARRTPHLCAVGQEVPQKFTNANNLKSHL